jgi:hypothetical protein
MSCRFSGHGDRPLASTAQAIRRRLYWHCRKGNRAPAGPDRRLRRHPHRSETATFDVRTSEITEPAEGDTLDVGVAYVIQGTPVRDAERLIWTIEARRL